MSQISQVVKYRPQAGSPFPFPKSGSDWTLDEIKYIGVDHKLDCDLDDIIPPAITLSPKIAEYLNERLSKPWEDLLNSRLGEDKEKIYARLLQLAGPQVDVGPYDIPFTSSPPSEYTPLETQEPKTPEGGSSPVQPSRPSPRRRFRHGSLCSSPASPTPKRMVERDQSQPQKLVQMVLTNLLLREDQKVTRVVKREKMIKPRKMSKRLPGRFCIS